MAEITVKAWEIETTIAHCRLCSRTFDAFNRKHHCRSCGKVLCDSCSYFYTNIPAKDLCPDTPSSVAPTNPKRCCSVCSQRIAVDKLMTEYAEKKEAGTPFTFGATTTAMEIAIAYEDVCKGKYVIVTGGNCGLGFDTARVLASKGAKVVLCSRDTKNGEKAVAKIKNAFPDADVIAMAVDLSSFESVKAFADAYIATARPLHVLINNAGIMGCERSLTKDGYEMQFGVNHLGHFLLTQELLPVLIATGTSACPARVVNLSSLGNLLFAPDCGIKFDDLNAEKDYDHWERYGQSKLANILFSNELQARMTAEGHHVISVSLHPGTIAGTNLIRHISVGWVMSALSGLWKHDGGINIALKEPKKNIEQGAATTLYATLSPDVVAGGYYADCREEKKALHNKARDAELAKQLWEVSERCLKGELAAAPAPESAAAPAQGGSAGESGEESGDGSGGEPKEEENSTVEAAKQIWDSAQQLMGGGSEEEDA